MSNFCCCSGSVSTAGAKCACPDSSTHAQNNCCGTDKVNCSAQLKCCADNQCCTSENSGCKCQGACDCSCCASA